MENSLSSHFNVGVVVIGRNEGARLKRALASVAHATEKVVYVDSGSTDGSVQFARDCGVEVVNLDMSTPFCAARARNAGYQRLIEVSPQVRFVQFLDGDSEIIANWTGVAVEFLRNHLRAAIVVGWLHERSPEYSIYNRMGDLEWNLSGLGELDAVGGIFMVRREAFESVGGFDSTVSAGEEPEFCQRLQRLDWQFFRIDKEMALHDLAMTRFSQWWRRHVRTGYGGADMARRFGLKGFRRITYRARFWALFSLLVLLTCSVTYSFKGFFPTLIVALVAISLWGAQLSRILIRTWHRGSTLSLSVSYAFFTMISFWPQLIGQIIYWKDCVSRRQTRLLEHKVG